MSQNIKFPDEQWAVFNSHANQAGARATKVCRERFDPDDAGMKILEDAYENGVMVIFKIEPYQATTLFAHACYIFANGLEAA